MRSAHGEIDPRHARSSRRRSVSNRDLGKVHAGAALEKLIHGRDSYPVKSSLSDDQREIFSRIFLEKLRADEGPVEGKRVFLVSSGGFGDRIEPYRNIERLAAEGVIALLAWRDRFDSFLYVVTRQRSNQPAPSCSIELKGQAARSRESVHMPAFPGGTPARFQAGPNTFPSSPRVPSGRSHGRLRTGSAETG